MSNTTGRLAVCLWLCLAAVGCEPPETPPDPLPHAREAAAAGNLAEAIDGYRDAVRQRPRDTALRLELARLHLENGDGASAEAAYRRAVSLGIHQRRVQVGLARALELQEKWPLLLALTAYRTNLPAADRFELLMLHARAQLNTLHVDPAHIRETFRALYQLVDANPQALDAEDALQRLELARLRWPDAAAAYQHYSCPAPDPETPVAGTAETNRRVLRVGAGRNLKTPAAAARVAQDGDLIEIDAGIYSGGVAIWRQNNLLIRGVGGRPHLRANGRSAGAKGIWVFNGNDTVVENIEFSGARVADRNGAGIRLSGSGLRVENCFFHHNENGILASANPGSDVVVKNSQFAYNGFGDGQSHNMYIGRVRSFVLEGSYSHHANRGHLVKSRAASNVIRYNRLSDQEDGNSSYVIDIPEGGKAIIVGNELMQSHRAQNPAMISFGAELPDAGGEGLFVVNNTFYNKQLNGIFVSNQSSADALVVNNLMAGATGSILDGAGTQRNNIMRPGLGLANPAAFDFRLLPGSPAIDSGEPVDDIAGGQLLALREYRHTAGSTPRQRVWTIDIGAREFCRQTTPPGGE